MTARLAIDKASLADIYERACKGYRQKLAEVEMMADIKWLLERLEDVMRLWDAVDKFGDEDELILTIEKRVV